MAVAIGDLNRDGKPDLVVADDNGNTVSVLLGNDDGTFGSPTTYAAGDYPYSVGSGGPQRRWFISTSSVQT